MVQYLRTKVNQFRSIKKGGRKDMEENDRIIYNQMLALDEYYYSEIEEEEKINGDDMFYDEVINRKSN